MEAPPRPAHSLARPSTSHLGSAFPGRARPSRARPPEAPPRPLPGPRPSTSHSGPASPEGPAHLASALSCWRLVVAAGGRARTGFGRMERPVAAAGGDVSLHNFSARLWEQLVHFHVMRLTDSLFLWVGATPHLRNLAVAMCTRYVSGRGAGGDEEGGGVLASRRGRGREGGGRGEGPGLPGAAPPTRGPLSRRKAGPPQPPVSGWSVGVPAGTLLPAVTLPVPGVAGPPLFPAGSSLTAFVCVSRTDLSPAVSLCCPIGGVIGVLLGSPDPGRSSRAAPPAESSHFSPPSPVTWAPRHRSPGRGPLCHLWGVSEPLPQTGGLRTAERAELRHPRAASSRLRACSAADTSGPLVSQPPHHSPAPVSQASCVHLSLSPSSQNTSPISGRVRLTLLMSQLHLQRPCFQIKSPSQVLGSGRQDLDFPLGGRGSAWC